MTALAFASLILVSAIGGAAVVWPFAVAVGRKRERKQWTTKRTVSVAWDDSDGGDVSVTDTLTARSKDPDAELRRQDALVRRAVEGR